MLYARWLYGKKVPSWKVAIGGRDFAHGEGLSPMAQEAIAEALDVVGLSPHAWLARMEAKTVNRHAPTPMFDDCNIRTANILYKL
jgi:hypothetical protein